MVMQQLDVRSHRRGDKVCVVVLGGGQGTRLYPLTAARAKPAVPLLGRYRLIDIPLSNCIHSDLKQIYVLTQYNSASLNSHINSTYKFDHFSNGFVEILAAEQTNESCDWFQGTADAVRQNLRHLRNMGAKYYLILSGDQLYTMDYRELLHTHLSKRADITVGALPVAKRDTQSFGIMKLKTNGRIAEFVEKPSRAEQLQELETPPKLFDHFNLKPGNRKYLASMGIYVFRAETLENLLTEKPEWIDFGKHVIPGALKSHKVFAHPFMGYWEDIGTVRSYYETHMTMAKPNPPFHFYNPHEPIYTHPRYLPGSRIQDAQVKNSIICEGSRITRAEILNSIIGIRSTIRPGVTIDRSIIMGADYFTDEHSRRRKGVRIGVGQNCNISGAIIDKNAAIGRGVVIKGSKRLKDQDGEGWAVRDGVVVVLKNAVIPEGTRIGG